MKRAKQKSIDGLQPMLYRLSNTTDKIYGLMGEFHLSWQVEIFRDGEWTSPAWMPLFKDEESALESCIVGFPLGSARVIRMEAVNNTIFRKEEVTQSQFLLACIKYGKV